MNDLPPPRPEQTRASLLLRLREGGPARELAWERFYELYAPIIAGFAHRLGARGTEAEDLVQEVMRGFFAASPEFAYDPAKGRFRAYLRACVWHTMGRLARERGRETTAMSELARRGGGVVEEVWDDVWETQKLQRALDAVRERYASSPDRERTFRAFEMCTILGRSTAVVAGELGLDVQSVRAARSRVGKALREVYEELDSATG